MSAASTVSETSYSDLNLVHRGKVRDVYQISETVLLLVATDRISAFACVLPTPVELKGRVLTELSNFWFRRLEGIVENHLLEVDFEIMPDVVKRYPELRGRSVLVKKTVVFPVECVVRGYLEGSGWKDYLATGSVCGHRLPPGLQQCSRLPEPIFTPATKAVSGHDENISFADCVKSLGVETASWLREKSLELYREASDYSIGRGIIIADTKFEFGLGADGRKILIDEVLTPDSSRFWPADSYAPGRAQVSFDKQFVREYLETLDWNKQPPAPSLPDDVSRATTQRYLDAFRILTGTDL